MEARRLLCFMVLVFSVVFFVRHVELPYGYVLSSLLLFSKSPPTAARGSFLTRDSSNHTENFVNKTGSTDANSTTVNAAREFQKTTEFPYEKKEDVKYDLGSKTSKDSNHSLGDSNAHSYIDFLGTNNNSRDDRVVGNKSLAAEMTRGLGNDSRALSYSSSKNSSFDKLQATNDEKISRVTSPEVASNQSTSIQSPRESKTSMLKEPVDMLGNNEKPSLTRSDLSTFVNNYSVSRNPTNTRRFRGPPAVVVPISEMNDMLSQSRVSHQSMKAQWTSPVDKELLNAKKLIETARVEKNPHADDIVYRNLSAFTRSYELMEKTLKIYIYSEGQRPIFHQPELNGIYASEGWFMKQLQENKHFATENPQKAHLFYLPFSSHVLQEVLYVPNSHSRKNLVRYLNSFLQNITTRYPFWHRASGADHFLVACHDWAPAETNRIMKNCIRALCNADVKGGFLFGKDVSLPETYVRHSTDPLKNLGGKPPSQRHILAFFAGKMHGYLRPVLLNFWENKDPDMKIFGKLQEGKGQTSYIQYMKSSKFCISARGYEAYTPRVVEAIFYDCVPVIISDNYVPPFFETLNWESFAVFVLEKDIPKLKNILASIPDKRYVEMQERVKQVQKHFLWHERPVKHDVFHMILHSIWYTRVFQMRP